MLTPYGTPYRTLRALACSGAAPTLRDCRDAEREARAEHKRRTRLAAQSLLIARALWSAYRAALNPTVTP